MLKPITLILLTISSNSTIFISSNYSSKDRSFLPFCTSFIAPSSMLKLWSMPSQRVYMWAWPLSSFVASLLWLADHKFLFQTVEVGLLQICENQNYVSRKIDQDQLIKPSVTILFHEVRQLYEEQKKCNKRSEISGSRQSIGMNTLSLMLWDAHTNLASRWQKYLINREFSAPQLRIRPTSKAYFNAYTLRLQWWQAYPKGLQFFGK